MDEENAEIISRAVEAYRSYTRPEKLKALRTLKGLRKEIIKDLANRGTAEGMWTAYEETMSAMVELGEIFGISPEATIKKARRKLNRRFEQTRTESIEQVEYTSEQLGREK